MNLVTSDRNLLTRGKPASELFTDRNVPIRRFAEYLNHDPPPDKLLFFHGEGGGGKSLLLRFLREKCCKRFSPEVWQQLKGMSDEAFATHIENSGEEDYTPVPSSFLDFGQQPRGEDQPRDILYGLLMLRRNLAIRVSKPEYQFRFPLSDFACFCYLSQKGKSPKDITRLFPSEEAELIGVLADFLSGSSWGNLTSALFNMLDKRLGGQITRFWKQRGLDKQWAEHLMDMNPDSELIERLPEWFARDLNAAMREDNAPPRLVLFFDTHEAFWGHEQRILPDERFFCQDEWLRRLLTELDFSQGIVAVMAGREKPRWDDATNARIPRQCLELQSVCHLSPKDAAVYLKNAGISDTEMRQSLIKYACTEPGEVHPLYLGLCADMVLTAGERNICLSSSDFSNTPEASRRAEMLIRQLLKYTDAEIQEAVHALAACRSFDRGLYMNLGKALYFHATGRAFRTLIRFSFVWQDDEQERYRIHNLLRRLDYEKRNSVTLEAHEFLEGYYREQGEIAEAIYHAICREPERGMSEWLETFNHAKQQEEMELCRALLKIREEMSLYLDRSHRLPENIMP